MEGMTGHRPTPRQWLDAYSLTPDLLVRLRFRIPSADDAEDAAAEAVIRAAARADELAPGNLLPWLRTVAANAWVDEVRKRAVRLSRVAPFAVGVTTAPGADEAVIDRDLARAVTAAIEDLPPELGFAMRSWADGVSVEDIAAALGWRVHTARRAVHRTRDYVLWRLALAEAEVADEERRARIAARTAREARRVELTNARYGE